jgi:hypothetical protein
MVATLTAKKDLLITELLLIIPLIVIKSAGDLSDTDVWGARLNIGVKTTT